MASEGHACRGMTGDGFLSTAPIAVGLALFWAWTHLMAFTPTDWSLAADDGAGVSWLASNVTSLVALAVVYVLGKERPEMFTRRALVWTMALLGGCASAVAMLDGVPNSLRVGCALVGTVANMALIACWSIPYADIRSSETRTVATLIAMAGSFAAYLAASALPPSISPLLMASLAPASALCHSAATRRGDAGPDADDQGPGTVERETRPSFLVLGFILVFSIPLNFLQSRGNGFTSADNDLGLAFTLALVLVALSCVAELLCLRKNWSVLAPITVLLLSFALLSSAFTGIDGMTALSGVTLAGYFLFLSVTYLQLGRCTAGAGGPNPVCAFSAGMFANAIGLLLGTLLGFIAQTVSSAFANVLTLVIVYGLFTLGTALLPHRMKQLLLNQHETPRDREPKNRYVADMVQSINEQCLRVAACFNLTERETVVLGYLVRGWNLQMIAEEEGLTRNTVKTHVTHIYQKLGVHTREELALVVESVEG